MRRTQVKIKIEVEYENTTVVQRSQMKQVFIKLKIECMEVFARENCLNSTDVIFCVNTFDIQITTGKNLKQIEK